MTELTTYSNEGIGAERKTSQWSLAQWLYYLEHSNRQEIQLGLARIMSVAQKLNVHAPACKVITVAGTNGKGSTVTALETIYHTAGYNVGAYTSPHLIHFNERIRTNLKPITDEALCQAFNLIEEARSEIILTYFEMTTLAALLYFKQSNLDIMILEVGLGGRLDATNIIDSDLAIITTIDYDHQDFLGFTLDAIGYEKAGILRKEKPFIYADDNPPASIIKMADNLTTPSYLYNKDFLVEEKGEYWQIKCLDKTIGPLPRPHIQLKSASAAILASLLMKQFFPISEEQLHRAMTAIYIPGRLQLFQYKVNAIDHSFVSSQPLDLFTVMHQRKDDLDNDLDNNLSIWPKLLNLNVLYDVSHNIQSARLLAETINQLETQGNVHAVFSALKDKDISGLIFSLKDCVNCWYPAQLDNKRAASSDTLLSQFMNADIFLEVCYTNPLIAFESALKQAKSGDLIVVFGSFSTVGHIMAAQH